MFFNERSEMINRLIDYAEADPPALFSVTEDATAADLDEAIRIISAERSSHVPAKRRPLGRADLSPRRQA